jgi:hypothetical protein
MKYSISIFIAVYSGILFTHKHINFSFTHFAHSVGFFDLSKVAHGIGLPNLITSLIPVLISSSTDKAFQYWLLSQGICECWQAGNEICLLR